jgi:translation initiation factor IF-2
MRLSQVAKKLNVGISTIVDHLASKGHEIEAKPNTKVDAEQIAILNKEFQSSAQVKEKAAEVQIGQPKQNVVINSEKEEKISESKRDDNKIVAEGKEKLKGFKVLGKIDLDEGKKSAPKKVESKKQIETKEPSKKVVASVAKTVQSDVKETKQVASKSVENVSEEKKTGETLKSRPEQAVSKKSTETVSKSEVTEKEEKPTQKPIKEEVAFQKVDDPKIIQANTGNDVSSETAAEGESVIEAKADSLKGLTVLGKIELPTASSKKKKPVASSDGNKQKRKRKRVGSDKPIDPSKSSNQQGNRPSRPNSNYQGNKGPRGKGGPRGKFNKAKEPEKTEVSAKEIQDKIKATMARMSGGSQGGGKSKAKYRKDKRNAAADAREEQRMIEQEEQKVLKVTEFVSANDLANLMGVSVNDVISTCMSLGMFVSINQRLDAEAITFIADEFNFEVKFITEDDEDEEIEVVEDSPEDLQDRAPVVTIMGHVDHGKTSLLDYIREKDQNVVEGEAGGITQHIGAYSVKTKSGKPVTFLDTPGHEAFTAMRARGTKLTDIVILVVAADDRVMPQTKEAINHATLAGVPIVVAINKVDKPTAQADKIREELSQENILVEDWGGKYQAQEVSAKTGQGIEDLLEKVLIESEMLELKANPDKSAIGAVVEASLDKGRGYLSTVLVQSGTLKIGDTVMAGAHYGRVKALMDHRGSRLKEAGPSMPVQVLGINGAPQAGDKFTIAESDREARETTTKRGQILREQSVRAQKHLTLDEIGRRLAIGNFKELNLIIKGDVDGSVEALTDSLLKLSTDEVQVNIIHKAVGQITESDVLLATASDAIIIGFQVRPSSSARTLAENEQIEIKQYSIIYKAIDDVKDALEGLLAPKFEEVNVGNIEIREVFKISKVGTVAGCYVLDGLVKRSNSIRIIREGIVKYEGEIGALKRFKDDVSEVRKSFECGLSIKNYNDLQEGDIIEAFEEREIKRKL